jgi:hypothetical protein
MAKKKITLKLELEVIVDDETYPPGQRSNEDIRQQELENWPEWILDMVNNTMEGTADESVFKTEEVIVTDYPAPKIPYGGTKECWAKERYYGDPIDCGDEPGGDDIRYDAEPGD